MDIFTTVVQDEGRSLFIMHEGGRFATPILVLTENDMENVVAKYLGVDRNMMPAVRHHALELTTVKHDAKKENQ